MPEGETVPGSRHRKPKQTRVEELAIIDDDPDDSPPPRKRAKNSRKMESSIRNQSVRISFLTHLLNISNVKTQCIKDCDGIDPRIEADSTNPASSPKVLTLPIPAPLNVTLN
jgi:hypothetical protein